MADDMGIPSASGAVPPWAAVGAQLLDTLLSRLKSDDPGGPRDGGDPDRRPRDGGPWGVGRPGTFEVDPAAFSQLVLPLLEAQPELFLRHLGAVEVVSEQQQQ